MIRTALCVVALASPVAFAQEGKHFVGAGSFGVPDEAFGVATALELLRQGDGFSFDIPISVFEIDPEGASSYAAGEGQLYDATYPTDASITFDVGASGHAHTMGLGQHGLTYEVRDNMTTEAGLRDELVIEWWPTPNTVSRHGGSIFTYSMTLTFGADEWSGVAPLRSIELDNAIGFSGYVADDEGASGVPGD